jgi:hypothetical protein
MSRNPIQTELKEIISSHDIVVFAWTTCPYCVKAKEALNEAGKKYKSVIVDNAQLQVLEQLTGSDSVAAAFCDFF